MVGIKGSLRIFQGGQNDIGKSSVFFLPMPASRRWGRTKFLSVHIPGLGDTVVLDRVSAVARSYLHQLRVSGVQALKEREVVDRRKHLLVAAKQMLVGRFV